MNLKEIQFKNFCQFHHAQRIQFASDNNDQNITLISGPHASGNTSILHAILFCLYGEQWVGFPRKLIDLINPLARKQYQSMGNRLESYVQLEFEHQKKTYTIQRTILGKVKGPQIIEAESEVTLVITEGDIITYRHKDPQQVLELIKSILGDETLDLFIFSTEMAEALTSMMDGQKQGHPKVCLPF